MARARTLAPTLNPSVLETLKATGSGACCQPIVPTGFPPFMHIFLGTLGSSTGLPSFVCLGVLRGESTTTKWARAKRDRELFYAQQNAASACEAAPFRHQPKRKSTNLIKDLVEVLAKNAKTLRGSLSPNETPWPGLISGFTCFSFDAGRATRDSDKTPG